MLQCRINVQARKRARMLRHAGDLIVEDMRDARGTVSSLQSEIGKPFATIHGVRLHAFRLKFGLKFLVTALQSVGVFALLFAAGIMVLNGRSEIGIVVAFIMIEGTLGRKL